MRPSSDELFEAFRTLSMHTRRTTQLIIILKFHIIWDFFRRKLHLTTGVRNLSPITDGLSRNLSCVYVISQNMRASSKVAQVWALVNPYPLSRIAIIARINLAQIMIQSLRRRPFTRFVQVNVYVHESTRSTG